MIAVLVIGPISVIALVIVPVSVLVDVRLLQEPASYFSETRAMMPPLEGAIGMTTREAHATQIPCYLSPRKITQCQYTSIG